MITKIVLIIAITGLSITLYKQQKKIETLQKAFVKTADKVDDLIKAYNNEAYRHMIIENSIYRDVYEEYEIYEDIE